jgi:hypothetical protein
VERASGSKPNGQRPDLIQARLDGAAFANQAAGLRARRPFRARRQFRARGMKKASRVGGLVSDLVRGAAQSPARPRPWALSLGPRPLLLAASDAAAPLALPSAAFAAAIALAAAETSAP